MYGEGDKKLSEITYKVKGTITDSKGYSMKFTNKDIVNLEIEIGSIKRLINNHAALKLQELVKELATDDKMFQSLIEESEK